MFALSVSMLLCGHLHIVTAMSGGSDAGRNLLRRESAEFLDPSASQSIEKADNVIQELNSQIAKLNMKSNATVKDPCLAGDDEDAALTEEGGANSQNEASNIKEALLTNNSMYLEFLKAMQEAQDKEFQQNSNLPEGKCKTCGSSQGLSRKDPAEADWEAGRDFLYDRSNEHATGIASLVEVQGVPSNPLKSDEALKSLVDEFASPDMEAVRKAVIADKGRRIAEIAEIADKEASAEKEKHTSNLAVDMDEPAALPEGSPKANQNDAKENDIKVLKEKLNEAKKAACSSRTKSASSTRPFSRCWLSSTRPTSRCWSTQKGL